MKLLLSSLLFALTVTNSVAQKIDIKDNIVTVDGTPLLKTSNCGMYTEDCFIRNNEGKEIISIDRLPNQRKPGTYLKVTFNGMNATMEVDKTMKQLVDILIKNKAVDASGNLVKESVLALKEKYGNRFSMPDSDDKYDND